MSRTAAPKKQVLKWCLHSWQSLVQHTVTTRLTADCFKAKTTFTATNQISESWSILIATTSLEGHKKKNKAENIFSLFKLLIYVKTHFKYLISTLGPHQGPLHLCLHSYVTKPFQI